jgi:hypothetical protein
MYLSLELRKKIIELEITENKLDINPPTIILTMT